jgi:hypothetical protein
MMWNGQTALYFPSCAPALSGKSQGEFNAFFKEGSSGHSDGGGFHQRWRGSGFQLAEGIGTGGGHSNTSGTGGGHSNTSGTGGGHSNTSGTGGGHSNTSGTGGGHSNTSGTGGGHSNTSGTGGTGKSNGN